jgi:PAS domain S-box-containing protein
MTVPSTRAGSGEHAHPPPRPALSRAMFDLADEAFCLCEIVVDASGTPVDCRFLDANGAFTVVTGIENPVGRTAREVLGDPDPQWLARLSEAGLGRRAARYELESPALGRRFDVLAVPVEPHGAFILVLADRTDRHREEQTLRRGEERFRSMARQLPLIVWQHDPGRGQGWVNDEFERYFGFAAGERRGHPWAEVLHPEDAAGYLAEFAAAVAERRPFHAEIRVRRADGTWRWVESWANPQHDAEGRYAGHLGISADVMDRHAAETALRSAVASQAYRARLLAALRNVADPVEAQSRAAQLLGEHLAASRVHYVEVDANLEYGVVLVDHHRGYPSVVGVHRFDDFGPLVMNQFRAGRLVVVSDVGTDPRLTAAERATTLVLGGVEAYVIVPLVKGGRSIALLVVHHPEPHDYTEEELSLIEDTADLTWAAVEQARAEKALRVRHSRAELVADLLSGLERQPTVAAGVQHLVSVLVPRVADFATVEVPGRTEPLLGVAHVDPELVETLRALRTQHVVPDTDPHSVIHAAVGARQLLSVITPRVRSASSADPVTAALLEQLAPRSQMAVPLDLGCGVRGVLTVGLSDTRRPPYTEKDLAFLEETAQRVGVVLAAARLREEEHDIAVRLQQALLPDELIWHPNVLVEARYHAASELLEVGGDWYDTFAWPDGRIGVMVGDVVGHNLDSAAAMGRLRAATSALATFTEASPAALMEALDRFAAGPNGTSFATAACVVIDPGTGRLAYTSAGHPPVIVVPPGGPPRRLFDAQSLPLCSLAAGARPEGVVTLAPGSLVVLYSDGLVERRRRSIEEGIVRIEQLLGELSAEPADVVADRLVVATSADAPPDDDVVVACFRYTPVLQGFRRTVRARADQLAGLRADLRAWSEEQALPDTVRNRLLLGIGEACANSVEHAYAWSGSGDFDVEVTHHGAHLTLQVRDRGVWRPQTRLGADRGRGTVIMQAVGHRFRRSSDADGTTVTLTVPLTVRDVPAGRAVTERVR